MSTPIQGKQLAASTITITNMADNSIDSAELVNGSIDGVHLSTDAKTSVLESKLVAAQVLVSGIAAGSSNTLSNDTMLKAIVDASTSRKIGGSSSVEAMVTDASDNIVNLRDATTNDPVEDGSQRQVYARLTDTETSTDVALTWDGTTTVLGAATNIAVGEFIALDSDDQYFEITAFSSPTITISNPGSLTIPTSSGAEASSKLDLTLSFFVDIAGSETAHTMGSETVDLKLREAFDLASLPFAGLSGGQFGDFLEVLPSDSYTDVGSGNPNTTSGGARVGTDASAIGVDAGSTDTVQGVLEAFQSAIDTLQSGIAAGTFKQEEVTTETITGSDTPMSDTLDSTPIAGIAVKLYLNGILQQQGAGEDYTISGSTITWLASSGSAVDQATTDTLVAVYRTA